MTRFSLLAALAVLALTVLPQQALAQTSYTEAGAMGAIATPFDAPPSTHSALPGLTFYTDRSAFDAVAGPLPLETFEGSNVPPGDVLSCLAPLDSATNDACYSTGAVIDGFRLELLNPDPEILDYVVLAPGFFGASSTYVGPNTFVDDAELFFDDEPNAVGFDIGTITAATFTIEIFGAGGSLGSTTVSPADISTGGTFFGVLSEEPIVSIQVTEPGSGGELFDNLAFGTVGCLPGEFFADAGPDQIVEATGPGGADVTLDGSASCGDIGSYSWALRNGPEIGTGVSPTVELPLNTSAVVLTVEEAVNNAVPNMDTDAVRIRVVDTTGPAITLENGTVVEVPRFSGAYVDNATATDLVDGPTDVTVSGAVDTEVLGEYLVTYSAVDRRGNPTVVEQTVTVVDDADIFDTPYGMLSNTRLTVHGDTETEGDAHANGSSFWGGGDPSSQTGNVSSVGYVRVYNGQWVDGDASGRRVEVGSQATVTGTVFEGTVSSVSMPSLHVSAGGRDIKVRANADQGLAPGSYGALRLNENATLTLEPGSYSFTSVTIGVDARLQTAVTTGPTWIGVAGNVILREGGEIGPISGDYDARYMAIRSTGRTVLLDDHAEVAAQLIAPSASVTVGSWARVVGPVVGQRIEVRPGAAVLRSVERDVCTAALATCAAATADGGPETASAPIAAASTALPGVFALATPYPNPARGQATVSFDVPEASDVRVVVYDVVGREVAVLADGPQEPGTHRATLQGSGLPSGVYVVRMTSGSFTATQRLTLVR